MRFTSEQAEWLVYKVVVGCIASAVILSTTTRPVSALSDVLPEENQRFEALSMSDYVLTRALYETSLELEPVEEADPLERYRGRAERLNPEELIELLELVGFEDVGLKAAWAVAMKESTGRPLAHNRDRSTGDNSYGLFQINMIDNLGPARREQYDLDSNDDLFDPVRNAEIAFELSRGGTDFGHWNVGSNAYRGNGSPANYLRWLAKYPGKAE